VDAKTLEATTAALCGSDAEMEEVYEGQAHSNLEPLNTWTEPLTIKPEEFFCHVTIIIIFINSMLRFAWV